MQRNGVSLFEMLGSLLFIALVLLFVFGLVAVGLGIGEPEGCNPNRVLYYRMGVAIDECNPFADPARYGQGMP